MHSGMSDSSKNCADWSSFSAAHSRRRAFPDHAVRRARFYRSTLEVKIYRRRVTAADDDSNPFAGGWLIGT
jgi:hypothetical protein